MSITVMIFLCFVVLITERSAGDTRCGRGRRPSARVKPLPSGFVRRRAVGQWRLTGEDVRIFSARTMEGDTARSATVRSGWEELMCKWLVTAAFAALLALGTAVPASAKTFRFANDGDVNSMDPYARNETFLLTFMGNIYEPLIRRGKHLEVEPALATEWKQ